eukprot:gene26824-32410_t
MGGILCPPPQELWPLGMAATYTIPEKIKFDEESLQALTDANISPGSRFSLSNIRAEAPTNNSCARMQCLRKGTTFSLNFTYSTGSQGCQIQFFVYSKVKGRKKGKNAVGDIVEKSIYKSPWLTLPAHAKKKNFSSSEHNLCILASQLPTYLHYRKYIHPSIYDIVLVVTRPGYIEAPAMGGGVGGGLVRMLSTRSIGEGIKGEASAPATRRGPPTNGSVLPSLYYSSVVAPSPGPTTPTPTAPPATGHADSGEKAEGDHFIHVDKQVYYVNMSVPSLQAHLESLGRDVNADITSRETGAAVASESNAPAGAAAVAAANKARKKKHKAAKRAREASASSSSAEVASRDLVGTEGMFSVSPDRVQPVVGKGKGTSTAGVVSYAILNNRNNNEGPGESEGVADEDAGVEEEEEEEEEVPTDSRFNILKSVLMGGGDTPTYFKPSQEEDQAFSPPTVQPAEPATPPVSTPIATPTATPTSTKLKSHHHHSHHHSRQQQGAVHSPPIIQGNHLLASPTSPTALPSSVTWTIAMEIKEHRYTLPAGGGDRMYLAKAIYDLKYHVGSSGSSHAGAPRKESAGNETKQANVEGNGKAAGGTKKIITFPSLPYISKTGPGQNIHQTPVRGFDEKSASLILGGDGEESHDLPDFVTKKEEDTVGALQDTTGECVVCLLYIQNSLNETANSTPKCPVCRENIALLVHIV